MPVGLFDFDGELVLASGDDFFGRAVFPLVETADVGYEPVPTSFGTLGDGDISVTMPILDLFGGDASEPASTPAPSLRDLLTSLFGGAIPEPNDDGFIIVGLLGGRVPAPAPASTQELLDLNSMVICPTGQPASSSPSDHPALLDIFGLF
jgi:hypothetical protein